ncbi:50S ribosomal protein L4 [Candidatus Wolfebacteria bacterium]|nr:MAG: 50S ribosomal protein L4 [Candidatus Wolfebacteria bacterium]
MEAKVYNQSGKETGKVTLPETVFNLPWNADLVHQVMVGMQANARTPVAHTHDRGEQRGGGKKPWRQKGTGAARHGSRRSPIWRGGGVTFGPRNDKDYSKKINRKMRTKALFTVLSQKLKDNEIIFVDDLKFEAPKTKDAIAVLANLGKGSGQEMLSKKKKNAAYIATSSKDMIIDRSFQNIGSVEVDEARNINAVDLLKYKYLVVEEPKAFIEGLEAKIK